MPRQKNKQARKSSQREQGKNKESQMGSRKEDSQSSDSGIGEFGLENS